MKSGRNELTKEYGKTTSLVELEQDLSQDPMMRGARSWDHLREEYVRGWVKHMGVVFEMVWRDHLWNVDESSLDNVINRIRLNGREVSLSIFTLYCSDFIPLNQVKKMKQLEDQFKENLIQKEEQNSNKVT